jgi:acetyl esterase/lipase
MPLAARHRITPRCSLRPTAAAAWASAIATTFALVLALAAPATAAALPSAATNVTRVLTPSGASGIGNLDLRTTFTDTTATGAAAATPLQLSVGPTYRIRTCVWSKTPGLAPQSSCEELVTKPNALTVVTGVTAPTAQLTIDRPAAGQAAATIAGFVLVDVLQPDGSYLQRATSWPAGGLPEAGIAVPATDQVAAAVLGSQGLAIPGAAGGGINSGRQDSICREDQVPATTPDEGSTTALGDLPFAYEVGEPAAGPVRGIMLLIHGGAWSSVGRAKLTLTRGDAQRWQARGWRTVNATYRPCAASVADVLTLYDRVRSTYGSALPICAFGRSAGGQLALLLAVRRPLLACVIAEAGIADLSALAHETTASGSDGPTTVYNWATAAFGADRLAQVSAAGSPVKARVLYAISAADMLVPWQQATDFAAAQKRRDPAAYVDTLHVEAGDQPFEHGFVSAAGLQTFYAHEQALVAPLEIGDVAPRASVRLKIVRSAGLRVRFTCAARCKVAARLQLSAATARRLGITRIVARGSATRSSRGKGIVTVRLTRSAKRRIGPAKAQLVSDVTVGAARRRQTAAVALRRP